MPKLFDMRVEVARSYKQWLSRLVDAEQLANLARSMGLGWFTKEDIDGLWTIGLLRADIVSSTVPVHIPSLLQLDAVGDQSSFSYADAREMEHRSEGYGSSIGKSELNTSSFELKFHPCRIYVLHHVARTLKAQSTNTQYLLNEAGVAIAARRQLESLRRWTSSVEFGQRFDYWNRVCETAMIAEPIAFTVGHPSAASEDSEYDAPDEYKMHVRQFFSDLGHEQVRQMRGDLAFAAYTIDDNRSIHVLLRLMKPSERSKLKGGLGCAMHFLAMAESIRRPAEDAFGVPLPEEDEIGPGQWFPGARKMLYGTDRVFDAPKQYLRDYLNVFGLDFGVKVRCYVEGATEYGAIEHAVGDFGHVQIIDLQGKFAEKGGKGLAFAESLDADKQAGVFSVILLDGDLSDNVRLVQRAAMEKRFTGSFFIASPDFECANFSALELIEVAFSLKCSNELESESTEALKKELLGRSSEVRSSKDFFRLLKTYGLAEVRKDKQWGKALMIRANEQPNFSADDLRAGKMRPIVEAVKVVLKIENVGFQRSLAAEYVHPTSGRMVPRTDK